MKKIFTENAPKAVGAYSQAIQVGNYLYISGQAGLNPKTGQVVGNNVSSQAAQAIKNIKAIAKEAGFDISCTIKTTCFLVDMKDFAEFNEEYKKHFISKPARSCVAVKQLPLDVLCEIEAVLYMDTII